MKKKEREMKNIAREEKIKCKALEREAKKLRQRGTKRIRVLQERLARSSDTVNPKRQKICEDECDEVGLQHREISESECAVCFGQWEEDDTEEWLMCTNDKCGVWSHTDFLEKCDDAYVCVLYQTCFL